MVQFRAVFEILPELQIFHVGGKQPVWYLGQGCVANLRHRETVTDFGGSSTPQRLSISLKSTNGIVPNSVIARRSHFILEAIASLERG